MHWRDRRQASLSGVFYRISREQCAPWPRCEFGFPFTSQNLMFFMLRIIAIILASLVNDKMNMQRGHMSDIKFSNDETDRIVAKVKDYFNSELDQEIGGFEAEFLIEFFAKEIGSYFYNRGLYDAQNLFTEKSEEITYLIQELEKPTL